MVHYRRHRLEGGTYFFTVALADRRASTLTERVDDLRAAVRVALQSAPFAIIAMVVLPEHLHAVWTLPDGDADYSGRWRAIKSGFTRRLKADGGICPRFGDGDAALWQRRFWEHTIRDAEDLRRHVDYVHFNPVKHGHVDAVADWPYSTYHREVRSGVLPIDWAGGAVAGSDDGAFGE